MAGRAAPFPTGRVGTGRRSLILFLGLLAQTSTCVFLYGLPNFLFHITMGYAALRGAGVALGKADFDALHSYPEGFRFEP